VLDRKSILNYIPYHNTHMHVSIYNIMECAVKFYTHYTVLPTHSTSTNTSKFQRTRFTGLLPLTKSASGADVCTFFRLGLHTDRFFH